MTKLPIRVAVLVATLLIANLQCVARCVSQPCGNPTKQTAPSKVPPCHRSQQPDKAPPASACDYATMTAAAMPDVAKSAPIAVEGTFAEAPESWVLPLSAAVSVARPLHSPRISPLVELSTVLKI
jgi:hypothetical protein